MVKINIKKKSNTWKWILSAKHLKIGWYQGALIQAVRWSYFESLELHTFVWAPYPPSKDVRCLAIFKNWLNWCPTFKRTKTNWNGIISKIHNGHKENNVYHHEKGFSKCIEYYFEICYLKKHYARIILKYVIWKEYYTRRIISCWFVNLS